MSPIEAMTAAHWNYDARRKGSTLLWVHLDDEQRAYLIEPMRAALTALRDNGVTEGMVTAHMLCSGMAKEQFRAMLDAALKGE